MQERDQPDPAGRGRQVAIVALTQRHASRESILDWKKNVQKFISRLQFSKQILHSKMLSLTSVLCKRATNLTRLAVAARWP